MASGFALETQIWNSTEKIGHTCVRPGGDSVPLADLLQVSDSEMFYADLKESHGPQHPGLSNVEHRLGREW